MRCFRNFFLIATGMMLVISCGCDCSAAGQSPQRIRIATWNTQLMFDGIDDGSEFSEYSIANNRWSAQKYEIRLARLCDGLILCGTVSGMGPNTAPDIIVLQEIENERIVYDLCNRLPQRNGHRYGAFVPPAAGSAFGSAVLSRYPVIEVTAHSADCGPVIVRPVMEVAIDVQGTLLTVFAVHWKSKAGADEGTETRRIQERLLVERMKILDKEHPGALYIVCGDFNQMPHEFSLLDGYANSWSLPVEKQALPLDGTYWYNDGWEAIDHFFCPSRLCDGLNPDIEQITLVAREPLLNAQGIPARYELYSGRGYSDHLPLVLTLRLEE